MERASSKQMKDWLKLYFIMGSVNCKTDPYEVLKDAIAGGITLFQFREKGEGARKGKEKIQFAKQLQLLCKHHQIPFIINDDVDLAIELNADGVHIGQDDENAKAVRKRIGDKIVGISAHNLDEVRNAIADGADYVGIGPVFPTKTKKDALAVQGTNVIQQVRDHDIEIPIVGIGGITSKNAAAVIEGGANGISVITAISHADSAFESAKELRSILDQKLKERS